MRDEKPKNAELTEEQPAQTPRQPLTQRTYQPVIDQQIAAGVAQGAFDNLRGSGKPLRMDDDALTPEDLRVGYRMLKTSGFAPPWIEMRKEIQTEQTKLATWFVRAKQRWPHANSQEQARLRQEFSDKIAAVNRLILSYNLSAPQAVGQLPMLRPQDELSRLG